MNCGVAIYTSHETLANFAFKVLDLEPDLILIYHGFNDTIPRMVWPPSAYRGDGSGWAGDLALQIAQPGWVESSNILRILSRAFDARTSLEKLGAIPVGQVDTSHCFEFWAQVITDTYPDGIFKEIPAKSMLAENPPVYFDRNIRGIIHLARGHGIKPVLVTFLMNPNLNDALTHPVMAQGVNEHNIITRAISRDEQVLLFDYAASDFPLQAELWADGIHMSAEGNRRKAEVFAQFLRDSGTLPDAPPLYFDRPVEVRPAVTKATGAPGEAVGG